MDTTMEYMQELLSQGDVQQIKEALSHVTDWTKELCVFAIMFDVFCNEAESNIPNSVFDYSLDINELTRHFIQLKLYLRRLDFDLPIENELEIYDYLQETNTSDFMLAYYLNHTIFYPQKVSQKLSDIFLLKEGDQSERACLYACLAEKLPAHKDFY